MAVWRAAAMAATLCVGAVPAAAQEANDVRLRFTGRIQAQLSTTSVDDDAGSTFETRRVRLAVDVTIRDWIRGIFEADYALGNVGLKRAYIDLGFDDAFALRMGQFKRPFSRVFLTSSLETPVIERGLRIRGLADAFELADASQPVPILGPGAVIGDSFELLDAFGHVDYELGAAVHGELGAFGYEAGIFNGTGQDAADSNDAKSVAARGTLGVGETPLSIGAAASYREVGVGDASVGGTAFALDAEWGEFRRPGLRLLLEGTAGENYLADETFVGVHGMAAWFHATRGSRLEGVEGAARVSWGDPNRSVDGDAGVLLTPGVNLYLFGRNRLSLNWDVFVPQDDRFSTEHALRAQAQFSF